MKKINKVFSLVMVLTLAACTFFSTAAFASNIEGYVGNIGILGGGGDVLRSGMSFPVGVISSKGQAEDVSALKVTWSVGDSSEVSITPTGYDSESNSWGATVKLLKGGCSPTIYATVNGVKLDATFNVYADPVKATSVTFGNNAVSLNGKGKTAKVNIDVGPTGVAHIDGDANPSVTSGNTHIATVAYTHLASGEKYFTVTGVANGTTSVYVKTASGPSATCLVTVTGAGTPATVTTPVATTSKSTTVASKPVTTTSKPATTSSTAVSSKPTAGSGASSSPVSVASAISSVSTESKVESAASSGVEVPQYTVSESSAISAVSTASSAPTEKAGNNGVNIAAIIIIVIIVCGGTAAFVVLRKKNKASGSMDDTQNIDISSKRKK